MPTSNQLNDELFIEADQHPELVDLSQGLLAVALDLREHALPMNFENAPADCTKMKYSRVPLINQIHGVETFTKRHQDAVALCEDARVAQHFQAAFGTYAVSTLNLNYMQKGDFMNAHDHLGITFYMALILQMSEKGGHHFTVQDGSEVTQNLKQGDCFGAPGKRKHGSSEVLGDTERIAAIWGIIATGA